MSQARLGRTTSQLITSHWSTTLPALTLGLSLCLLATDKAKAASFTFTKIADTSTLIPGGTGTFTTFNDPSLNQGNLAFLGRGNGEQEGIYTRIDNTLNVVANRNTFIPGRQETFLYLYNPSLSNGSVAFTGGRTEGYPPETADLGIYTNLGGSLQTVVDQNTPRPNSSFNLVTGAVFNNGIVAFKDRYSDIYTIKDGVPNFIASRNTFIPGGSGAFSSFGDNLALDNGSVAFAGFGFDPIYQAGIYTNLGGSLKVVANRNTVIPGSTSNFETFGDPALSNEFVAFRGFGVYGSNISGIYTNMGDSLLVVADSNTLIPNSSNRFLRFGDPSLDNGNVAFWGFGGNFMYPTGIYTNLGGSLSKVIAGLDALYGKTVAGVYLRRQAISNTQIAFRALFTDGSQGIYLANLNPTTTSVAAATAIPESSGVWGLVVMGAFGAMTIGKHRNNS